MRPARLEEILECSVVGLDTETTGLHPPQDRAFSVALRSEAGHLYLDLRRVDTRSLSRGLRRHRGLLVSHNASFDYRSLLAADIVTDPEQWDCTVIRAAIIDERLHSYELDALGKLYLGRGKATDIYQKLAELFGGRPTKRVQMARIAEAPPEVVEPYALEDVDLCYDLWFDQETRLEALDLRRAHAAERSVMPRIMRMAWHGVRVDLDEAEKSVARLTPIIMQLQADIDRIAGREININSPNDVRELFKPVRDPHQSGWLIDTGEWIPSTGSGNAPSMAAPVLLGLESPTAKLVIKLRSLMKTRDTFLRQHVIGHAYKGRVYPSINQTKQEDGSGTGTVRLSYTDPALQQIPARDKQAAEIVKSAFLPDEDQDWVDGDLASFEVRVFASFAAIFNDKIRREFEQNPELDFHQFVAELTGMPRNATGPGQPYAKQLNLSMIFNSGKGAIANKMGMPWTWAEFRDKKTRELIRYMKPGPEAMAVIDLYHQRLPGVKEFADDVKELIEERARGSGWGHITTWTGRRVRIQKRKAYKGSGIVIQSTAGQLNKVYIERAWDVCEKHGGKLLLNTHDSYSMSLPRDPKHRAAKAVKKAIEEPTDSGMRVPIIIEINKPGRNWFEAWNNERML